MKKMKFYVFLLAIMFTSSVLAAMYDYGVVDEIYPGKNVVYFKLKLNGGGAGGGEDCLDEDVTNLDSKYYIAIDDDSTSNKSNTLGYFYYSMLMYSYQFNKTIKVALLSTTTCPFTETTVNEYGSVRPKNLNINYLVLEF